MEPSSRSPHDRLFASVFSRPAEARALLRAALPAAALVGIDLRTIRLESGRMIDGELGKRTADLLFSARRRGGAPVLLYVLFEHKSTLARLVPLQLLGYVTRRLEVESGSDPGAPLPFVVPVLVYHGVEPAPSFVRLDDLFDRGGSGADELRRRMPAFEVPVFDVGRIDVDELVRRVGERSPFGAAALALMRSIRGRDLAEVLRALGGTLRRVFLAPGGAERLRILITYVSIAARHPPTPEKVIEIMVNDVHPEAEEVGLTLAEQWRREGLEKGLEKGREEGETVGSRREAADALLRVLGIRFGDVPDWARARVADADVASLRSWLEHAVVRERLDDVFRK